MELMEARSTNTVAAANVMEFAPALSVYASTSDAAAFTRSWHGMWYIRAGASTFGEPDTVRGYVVNVLEYEGG